MVFSSTNEIEMSKLYISVCKCGTIEVTLSEKSKRAISIPELAGLYKESSTVNGRSSWISINKRFAIWYHPDFKVSGTEEIHDGRIYF